MMYLGDFAEDATVRIPFNTFDSNDPSGSVTITELADADIKVHKDGSLTQIVTDGATVVINFDGITGNHMITIDTSAHADYTTGAEYAVRIEGTVVDVGVVNAWIGAFSIERAGGALAVAKTIKTETALIVTDTDTTIPGLIGTAQSDLDKLTGSDGATLATAQGNYAPAKAGDSMALGAGVVNDASLAGGLEIVFETDFGTNYNVTRNAWVNNYTDIIGTMGAASFAAAFLTASKFAAGAIDAAATSADFVAEIADGVYDEDIVAAHGTADTAGLILRALGAVISQRSNNATLNALLGIPDTAGTDLPEQAWAEGTRVLTASTNFNDISEANVLTQVNAAIDTAIPELSAGVPAATPTLRTAAMFIYMGLRNKRDTTSASDEIHNNAGAVIATAILSDDTVVYISGEYA